MKPAPTIATWFVSDAAGDTTFLPQIGTQSTASEAQAVYRRCTAAFYASSLALNPDARHVFYTNTPLPLVDGIDMAALFERWGIEVVILPITYRLPRGAVKSWGNQFYVFDVIDHHAEHAPEGDLVILDSDCLFVRPAGELLAAIEAHGALTYELGLQFYPPGTVINHQTRAGMARFVAAHGGPAVDEVAYCGGEIYAVSGAMNRAVSARAKALWPDVMAQGPDAPREEAHLLSCIYALEGVEIGTANRFISRMWTTFKHNTLRPEDDAMTVWHLPAEKKTGFARLFRQLARSGLPDPRTSAAQMGLTRDNYARLMGYPRRSPGKFVGDLALKLREKAAALSG